ncbi:MAG: aminotransferase class I/II-fold pyridoxal phosphate-dependent enzyme [Rhodobacteraceae bacterium]|nr:aminotransferase class I/II-fold pyridoxal phosphate-dependent enzyme [Paracoccaceae bacterium]
MKRFTKSFTQQQPLPEAAIERAVEILHSGRLHRYNLTPGEVGETALLEQEFAVWQGARYCVACASGGAAMQIALRAVGLKPGEPVLANAYTLAPVPGAIHAAGGALALVEINDRWVIDFDDLRRRAEATGARLLMLSHMRGRLADMEALTDLCAELGLTVIEDCAHTMGARWNGKLSGGFGKVACFSTQTYKHMNSGEGGLLTTDDPDIAARAVLLSGSYMLYDRHGAAPDAAAFEAVRYDTPNCSARMDHLRAALLRAQLPELETNIEAWNARYRVLEAGLAKSNGVRIVPRPPEESYVGSSIQFHATGVEQDRIPDFVAGCGARGVELKWFGAPEPHGFTSRYDHWRYATSGQDLPQTRKALATTCDMRVPLTFSEQDCADIAEIIVDEMSRAIKVG